MIDRIRLLPALMVCALLLFGLKAVNLVTGVEQHLATRAYAQAEEGGEEMAAVPAATDGEAAMVDGPAVPSQMEAVALDPIETGTPVMSESEIAVLASLAKRREELDRWQRQANVREQLLRATEKRVEQRITELKDIEQRIQAYVSEQEQASAEQLASLVKMYESMKPKDAARIFERLDMGVLLSVVERMNARKMAAVMAKMDPVAAQELTVELATRRELPASIDELEQPIENADGQG